MENNMKKWILAVLMICLLSTGTVFGQETADNQETEKTSSEEESRFTHVKRRETRPIQLQLSQTFSSANPYSGAPGAAFHLGYQFSPRLYFGWTSSFFYGDRNLRDESFSYHYDSGDKDWLFSDEEAHPFGQEGAMVTSSRLDPIHLAELRVTPWDFGLYFSFGLMQRGAQRSTTEFGMQSREIGANTYQTSLEATLDYELWYGAAIGMGFNYIFESGLVLGANIVSGIGRQTPRVTVKSSAAVSEADLAFWKKQIEHNEKQIPHQFGLSIGYAL